MNHKSPYYTRLYLEAYGAIAGLFTQILGSTTECSLNFKNTRIPPKVENQPIPVSKPSSIITCFWNDYSKKSLINALNVNNRLTAIGLFSRNTGKYPIIKTVVSTVVSTFASSALTYPLVYAQQKSGFTNIKEANDAIAQNIKGKHYLSLYRGFLPHSIYNLNSNLFSNLLTRKYLLRNREPSIANSFLFGFATNIVSTVVLFPLKRVRNEIIKLEEHKSNEFVETFTVFKDICKNRTLYKGIINQIVVSAPQYALETVIISQLYKAQEKRRISYSKPAFFTKPPTKKYVPGKRWW